MGQGKKWLCLSVSIALLLSALPAWAFRGEDYTNYASVDYKGYPRKGTDIYDWYDYFGEKLLTGYSIYDFIDLNADQTTGDSYVFKSYRYNRWVQELIILADEFEGMKHRLVIGDEVKTKFGSFMLDKAGFNGVRWDMSTKYNDWTIISSRISDPIIVPNDAWKDPAYESHQANPINLFGIYNEFKLFKQKLGIGYVNCHLDNNVLGVTSMYGVGTGNTGLGILGFSLYGNLRALNYKTEYYASSNYANGKPADKSYPAYQIKFDLKKNNLLVGGNYHYVDSNYSTTFTIPKNEIRTPLDVTTNKYELVDDNDDNDQYADDIDQLSYTEYLKQKVKVFNWLDGVFPGLDKNKNGVSDYNENRNAQPDYDEDFLRYNVDSPDFEFGDDFNNNGIIDYFENDNVPDYDHRRDRSGAHLFTKYDLSKELGLKAGVVTENMPSNEKKRSDSLYSIFSYDTRIPKIMDFQLRYYIKRVRDEIPDDTIQYTVNYNKGIPETQYTLLSDKLTERDSLVNTLFLNAFYNRFLNLEVETKIKYETNLQDLSMTTQRQTNFTGIINRFLYKINITDKISLVPMIKTQYELRIGEDVKSISQNAFIFRVDYKFTNKTRCIAGIQFLPYRDYIDFNDYDKTTYMLEIVSQVLYMKYNLAMVAGVRREQYNWLRAPLDTRDYMFLTVYMGG